MTVRNDADLRNRKQSTQAKPTQIKRRAQGTQLVLSPEPHNKQGGMNPPYNTGPLSGMRGTGVNGSI